VQMTSNGDKEASPSQQPNSPGSILQGAKDKFLQVHSSIRTPPPGFALDAARFYGENVRRAAAASAPPMSFLGVDGDNSVRSHHAVLDDGQPPRVMQRFSSGESNGLSAIDDEDPIFAKSRTMSYNNLALALGEGLAECMGDSLSDSRHPQFSDFLSSSR